MNFNDNLVENSDNILNSQPPLGKIPTLSQLRQNLYPNRPQLSKSKLGLFSQFQKVRKITNPTKKEADY
jgi:hypothetical protein